MKKPEKHFPASFYRPVFICCLAALLALSACLPRGTSTTPVPPGQTTAPAATRAVTPTTGRPDAGTATPSAVVTLASAGCGADPITAGLVEQVQPEAWMQWIRRLSGAEPVTIGGETVTIQTRFTPAMFDPRYRPQPNARGFEYLLETVRGWYPAEQIEVQSWTAEPGPGQMLYGQNLILTLPGTTRPNEVVILSAHFDSSSMTRPEERAPGAEDNGSGSAALLEAARLLREYRFERTIRIIWFTGEELGLLGSKAYIASEAFDADALVGVVNLDMFGHDTDGDRCFELHVGTLPASDRLGRCFVESARAYDQGLDRFDYITDGAVAASDHGPFWDEGVGAIEILENMFENHLPQGCANADPNPAYHSPEDTHEKINPDSGIRIVRAALATISALAGPQ